MLNNKTRRNIWLTLAILSVAIMIERAIRVVMGELQWWHLISAVIITGFCVKFYLCYKRQVKKGNLYGRVNDFK